MFKWQQSNKHFKEFYPQDVGKKPAGIDMQRNYVTVTLCIAVRSLTCHSAKGTRMPCRITQCYLPPDRGDIPAFTPAEVGTRLSDPGLMQSWVDLLGSLHTEMVYPPEDAFTHPGTNRARRALTSFIRRTPLTTTPHTLCQPYIITLLKSNQFDSFAAQKMAKNLHV